MREYIIGVPDDEPLSSLRRSGKTITAIAKITGNCDEVIRCRDCKYFTRDTITGVTIPGTEYCIFTMNNRIEEDDFCSRAERKSE